MLRHAGCSLLLYLIIFLGKVRVAVLLLRGCFIKRLTATIATATWEKGKLIGFKKCQLGNGESVEK